MAEDVDGENPCKKLKLDEDHIDVKSQTTAIADSTEKPIEKTDAPDKKEKIATEMEAEAMKEGDIAEGEESDSGSSVSALSDLSGLSGEESWKGQGAGPMSWVYRNMQAGVSPRSILEQIIPDASMIPDVDDFTLWKLVISIVNEPPPREKLPDINTIEDVLELMKKCQKIMVLTGAGVSVSCGIPDFRSRNGVYARLAVDFPDLPDPQAMFDIHYFKNDQRPFFKFAKEIFPGQFEPSKCHKFIKLIESHGKLLRNYTQNIDTLEQVAGIENVIQCHGSFATATCMVCGYKCPGENIKDQIMKQVIPVCPKCEQPTAVSVMKPDIVFFGESLPEEFHQQMAQDKDLCDLLIVIGSSLKVRPVALIPNSLPANVPQILINKEPLRGLNFDVELLGDCDRIISELCRRLGDGWETLANKTEPLTQISLDELLTPPATPTTTSSHSFTENTQTKPNKFDSESKSSKLSSDRAADDLADTTTKTVDGASHDPDDINAPETVNLISEQDATSSKTDSMQASTSQSNEPIQSSMSISSSSAEAEAANVNQHKDTAECVISNPCIDKTVSSTVADSDTDVSTQTIELTSVGTDKSSVEEELSRVDDNNSCLDRPGKVDNNSSSIDKGLDMVDDSGGDKKLDKGIDNTSCLDKKLVSGDGTVRVEGKQADSLEVAEGKASSDTMADSCEGEKSAAGPSTDVADLAAMWQPKVTKMSVAQRLAPNQYCLIPPHRYVFNEAEVFTVVEGESDWEDMLSSDSESDHDNKDGQDNTSGSQGIEKSEADAEHDNQGDENKQRDSHCKETSEKLELKDTDIYTNSEITPQASNKCGDVKTKSEPDSDRIAQSSVKETTQEASSESACKQSDGKADQEQSL